MNAPTIDEIKKAIADARKTESKEALLEVRRRQAAGPLGREVTPRYIAYLESISGEQNNSNQGEHSHEGDDQAR